MTIKEYQDQKKQKGMTDFMNVVKTGLKVGKTVADVATGNWLGAAATWMPDIVKSTGDAMGLFEKWKQGRVQPFVSSSDRGF